MERLDLEAEVASVRPAKEKAAGGDALCDRAEVVQAVRPTARRTRARGRSRRTPPTRSTNT